MKPEILKAWMACQAELQDPEKVAVNSHFKSRYADLRTVLEAVRPVLQKHGFVVAQAIHHSGEEGHFLETKVWHVESGEMVWDTQLALMLAEKPTMQALGSAITYARRYAISTLLGIASRDEDDDGEAAVGRGRQAAEPAPRNGGSAPVETDDRTEKAKRVWELATHPEPDGCGMALPYAKNWLKKYLGVQNLLSLSDQQMADAIDLLELKLTSDDKYLIRLEKLHGQKRVLVGPDPVKR